MSQIQAVIAKINTTLKNGFFNKNKFQRGEFYDSVVELLRRDEKTYPAVVDDKGNVAVNGEVVIDDKKTCQVYHRLISTSKDQEESEIDDFGDGNMSSVVSHEIKMVFIGNKDVLNISRHDIETALMLGIPKEFNPKNVTDSQWKQCHIEIDSNISNTSEEVALEEYGDENTLNERFFMLSLNYVVKFTYSNNCYALCE